MSGRVDWLAAGQVNTTAVIGRWSGEHSVDSGWLLVAIFPHQNCFSILIDSCRQCDTLLHIITLSMFLVNGYTRSVAQHCLSVPSISWWGLGGW